MELAKHIKEHEALDVLDQDQADGRYFKLDQTTPQEIINGRPIFTQGLVIKEGERIYFDG